MIIGIGVYNNFITEGFNVLRWDFATAAFGTR